MWQTTVVEHHRLRRDIAVVRLIGDSVPFRAGQSVEVALPGQPDVWRRLSPALPPSRDGKLEFHVRAVPGGFLSTHIVESTKPGDVWQIREPRGAMTMAPNSDVVAFAGGTGLAPIRALILDRISDPWPARVHLFIGGRTQRDLYAEDMLVLLGQQLPWLTVIKVLSEETDPEVSSDPWWQAHHVDLQLPASHTLRATLADIAAAHGAFVNQQVLVCGSPAMTEATLAALNANGTPSENVKVDPLS